MKLEDIGFYTLSDKRAKETSFNSDLQRCELILTDRCNFNCVYCRGVEKEYKGDITFSDAKLIIDLWSNDNLHNVRFSGGEPTLWPELLKLVEYTNSKKSINRIALSTNGSASLDLYLKLIFAGVNDFSISLDACCSSEANKMTKCNSNFKHISKVIKILSLITYVTVGVVLNDNNKDKLDEIIQYANSLGVSDIRIISSAQSNHKLNANYKGNKKILNYRLNNIKNNRHVRGLLFSDCKKCHLVKDDMAVLKGHHFPCIIYMREKGEPIGSIYNKTIKEIRKERENWFNKIDTHKDIICKNNCLDVCIDHNNKVEYK